MGLADAGQILVTDSVRNLVAGKDYRFSDHGTHDLKGFDEGGAAIRGGVAQGRGICLLMPTGPRKIHR